MKMQLQHFKILLLLVSLFTQGTLLCQVDKFADSLLLEIKYAPAQTKIDLVNIYIRKFNTVKPEEVLTLVDENFQNKNLSELDSASFYLYQFLSYVENT